MNNTKLFTRILCWVLAALMLAGTVSLILSFLI